MDGPLAGSERSQTVDSEMNAFSDAHAGVAQKKQCIAREIIAPQQFLLYELILLRS
jgi:hypothetical protein